MAKELMWKNDVNKVQISETDYHLSRNFFQNPLRFDGINVSQIGRMFCNRDTIVDTHVHRDLFELTAVTDGRGEIVTNGVAVPVEKGDIYLSLPCDSHKIVSDSVKPLKFDFFAFTCDKEQLKEELEYIEQNYYSSSTRIFRDERARSLIGNAIAELGQENPYSDELLGAVFHQIIIYLIRGFKNVIPERHFGTVSHAEVLCYKLMNYIDTHIYSLVKLEELSEVTDYSYGYLSAVFKKTTSNTLSNYYQEKRLDTARMLLLERQFKIVEIAEMLNYASVYSFSKAFAGRFGVSPRNYRKEFELSRKNT